MERRCFMMEIDPLYIDVIIARWEKFTGKKAALIEKARGSVTAAPSNESKKTEGVVRHAKG